MNVLVIGSGGREHAIAWALKESARVEEIYCAPGNAGTALIAHNVPIAADDLPALCTFAKDHAVDLTVVGSESPLVAGIVDLFESNGLTVFGPSKQAAQLEGSKAFLKAFLHRHHIPTARSATFRRSDYEEARKHIAASLPPYVIKTDGLAAGKGVAICNTADEALATLRDYFQENVFGSAADTVVIEEFMEGEEASVFAMCDGEQYVLLPPAQDHKRIGDGDTGKNTGGMGAYAPAPVVTPSIVRRVEEEIIQPTLRGMKEEGSPYKGCLYVGLMITREGPKVVEFNVRLGDPETQAVLPLIRSDVFELLYSCATGSVKRYSLQWKPLNAAVVVLAAQGYPDAYPKGMEVKGLHDVPAGTLVFHAGTKLDGGKVLTSGGRVFGVTAVGDDLKSAIENAYRGVERITFDGVYFRHDIGQKGLRHLSASTHRS